MVRHVDDGSLVSGSLVPDVDGILFGEGVGDICGHVSREVHVAVR